MTPRDARVVLASNLLTETCGSCHGNPMKWLDLTYCPAGCRRGDRLRSSVVLGSDQYEMTTECNSKRDVGMGNAEPPCISYTAAGLEIVGACDGCGLTGRVPAPVGVYENVSIDVEVLTNRHHEGRAEGYAAKVVVADVETRPLAVAGSAHLIDRKKVVSCTSTACTGIATPHIAVGVVHLPPAVFDSLRGSGPVLYLTGIEAV